MPLDIGATRPIMALAATAASTAVPPRSSTATPACAARGDSAATIPYREIAIERACPRSCASSSPVVIWNPIASPAKKIIARHACFCIFPLDPSPPSAKAAHRRMLAHSKRPRSRKQEGKDAGKQEGFSPCVRHGAKRRLAVPCLPSSLLSRPPCFLLGKEGEPPLSCNCSFQAGLSPMIL